MKTNIEDTEEYKSAQEAYYRSLRSKKSKWNLTFEDSFALFKNDCLTLTEIGAKVGVSREAARKRFINFFAKLIPGRKNGKQRARACTLKRRAVKSCTAPDDMILHTIYEKAQIHGLKVKQEYKKNHKFQKKRLTIQGKHCAIQYASNLRSNSKSRRRYAKITISKRLLRTYDYTIVYVREIDKVFIVPAHILAAQAHGQYSRFHIPCNEKLNNGAPPKVNWKQFEEAWHLLQ